MTADAPGWNDGTVPLPIAGTSPSIERMAERQAAGFEDLVHRLGPVLGRPVDAMQVAAALESDGVTDQSARVDYGRPDVFALAEDVFARLDRDPTLSPPPRSAGGGVRRALRDVSHGLVYLLISALLPAAAALLGRDRMLVVLVLGGAFGWVWSAGAAWLAYRLLGRGLLTSAGRAMRWSVLTAVAVGAAAGAAVASATNGDLRLAGFGAGLLAFQMASTASLFYRREGWLVVVMAPAVVTGVGFAVTGRPGAAPTATIGGVCVLVALGLAVAQTTRSDRASAAGPLPARAATEPPLHRSTRPDLGQLLGVLGYAALCAALLLHMDARYVTGPVDLAIAAAPLIVGMGVVEWRARRFHEQARNLLRQVHQPRRFAGGVWLLLVSGLLAVTVSTGALAVALLAILRRGDLLSDAGVVLIAAHVGLAGVYFLGFVLAGHARYGRLSAALGSAVVVHIALTVATPGPANPLRDGIFFLASVVLLQGLLMAILAGVLTQAWRYR